MADRYFHYTSRVAAQMIVARGWLQPGAGGSVYLTDDEYSSAADAANRLGIPVVGPAVATGSGLVLLTKPVEVVCVIPAERVPTILESRGRRAAAFRDWATGTVIYSGGGREFTYPRAIDVSGLSWRGLSLP